MGAMVNIDWQKVALNIRSVVSLSAAARRAKIDASTLRKLARGEVAEPKFSSGIALLDLHYALCPDRHDLTNLRK
jgi:hypothetical protein